MAEIEVRNDGVNTAGAEETGAEETGAEETGAGCPEVGAERAGCLAESTATDSNMEISFDPIRERSDNRKKPRLPASRADKWTAVWMLLVAYMAVEWFWIGADHRYYGLGVFLYTMAYGTTALVYAARSGRRLKPETIFWFAVMALCGFSYVWVYNQSLMWFLPLFLRLVSLYFTAVAFDVLIDGETGDYFIVDSYLFLVLVPFKNFTAQLQILRQKLKRFKLAKEILWGLAGFLAAIPMLAVIIELLSGADDNFAGILSNGFRYVVNQWGHILWTGILAVPVSAYLYGQMYGCARKRGTDAVTTGSVKKGLNSLAVVPMAGMVPALVSVVGLYLLFIGLQGSYYLDALRGVLPEEFTYSEYARQGFFELVAVSIINLGIICLSHLLYRRKLARKRGLEVQAADGTAMQAADEAAVQDVDVAAVQSSRQEIPSSFLRYYTVVISVLTLFLIATAMTKMYLYIRAYGLTPLRVIPSVFMAFLAVVFLLTAASKFMKVPVMRISVCAFAAGFAVMAVCGMDGRIAAYNLNRWQEGTLHDVPEETLVRGHLSSVLPVYDVWKDGDEMTKIRLERIADAIYCDYTYAYDGTDGIFQMNRERRAAMEALKEMEESFNLRGLSREEIEMLFTEMEEPDQRSRR